MRESRGRSAAAPLYRPLFHLPPRAGLATLVVAALAVVAGVRVASGLHPHEAVIDAGIWAGAAVCVLAWYSALRDVTRRVHRLLDRAVWLREQDLIARRRAALIAAPGDRFIAHALSRRWPGLDERYALLAESAAHVLRSSGAFMLGITIVAAAAGETGTVGANVGASPVVLALGCSLCGVLAGWCHLGWRWLGWRRRHLDLLRVWRRSGARPDRAGQHRG